MIERASVFAAGELHSDNALRGLDREHFIDRLAYHYDQVNYIHPFREGNGRVQRVLWNPIALARDGSWTGGPSTATSTTTRAAPPPTSATSARYAPCSTRSSPPPRPPAAGARTDVRPNGRACRSPSPPEAPADAGSTQAFLPLRASPRQARWL
jgi:cell filamentation protein